MGESEFIETNFSRRDRVIAVFFVVLIVAAAFSQAAAQTQYSMGSPTNEQQDMLELINRARANGGGKLLDPTLQLVDADGTQLTFNDNWRSDQEAEIIATTVAPTNNAESAVVYTLPASGANHTAIVRGAGGSTGIAVVDVFALN